MYNWKQAVVVKRRVSSFAWSGVSSEYRGCAIPRRVGVAGSSSNMLCFCWGEEPSSSFVVIYFSMLWWKELRSCPDVGLDEKESWLVTTSRGC